MVSAVDKSLKNWYNKSKKPERKEKIYQIAAYKLTRAQVKTIIFRYVFTYYNRVRICSVNPGGLPPVKYREWVTAHAAWSARRAGFSPFCYAPLQTEKS